MSPPAPLACPALFVAAPASNQGKTTVTAALARLHARAGRRVRVFKCGPDFLDPQILAVASGAPVYNLDLWMCGEDDAARRLEAAAHEADLILVEGVMGLYDGTPSGADIARRFNLPVLAVIDGASMAQTFGAVVHGLMHYQSGLPFSGVLANRVGSERHAAMLRESLPAGARWYGHLPRDAEAALPSRHLGLVQAQEVADLEARLDRIADVLPVAAAELPAAVTFAAPHGASAGSTTGSATAAAGAGAPLAGRRIAVARDAAFNFIYPANLDLLRGLGAAIEFFSPLADAALPPCDAVWLPGGYPELHAARIAANAAMGAALRAHHAAGKPLLAECGGMMALFETLTDAEGAAHALFGLLPGSVRMQKKLAALGLQEAELPEGRLRGHTFHYSQAATPLAPLARATAQRGTPGEAIYREGRLTASYVHFYFPSGPEAAAQLFL